MFYVISIVHDRNNVPEDLVSSEDLTNCNCCTFFWVSLFISLFISYDTWPKPFPNSCFCLIILTIWYIFVRVSHEFWTIKSGQQLSSNNKAINQSLRRHARITSRHTKSAVIWIPTLLSLWFAIHVPELKWVIYC